MRRILRRLVLSAAALIARLPSPTFRRALIGRIDVADSEAVFDAVGARIRAPLSLRQPRLDLSPSARVQFEELVGALVPSTPLAYGIALMTPRQLAYIFGLARAIDAKRAVEIGRYKGGATLVLAAAMGRDGRLWSIDNGSLAADEGVVARDYDRSLASLLDRFGLTAQLIEGDSRTVAIDVGEVDLILFDGDHSYSGVRADVQRWAGTVRVGGYLLFDDAFPLGGHQRGVDSVGRVVDEITRGPDLRLECAVDRLAVVRRIA